jgi:hypothetical protein
MKLILKLTLLLCLLSTCNPDDEEIMPADGENSPGFFLPIIIPSGAEQYLNESSDYIFDQEKLSDFELVLSPANLAKIDADPAAEAYVEGMLLFEGDTISPVGIRYKGSIGAFVNCLSGGNWANPSGRKICTKLSMKVKINWEGREEKFYGLKKLQFHSQNLDDSQLRDRVGYWLFRQMGVPAPRAVHARLTINGQYSGLYSLVEQVDGRFTRYHFEDGKGNLYKEVWPLTSSGAPASEVKLRAALETNEDENPSVAIVQSFGQRLASATETEVPTIIEGSMDVDEIMSYIVVDRAIRHDDGPFHWYCSGSSCSNHNYYWYEEPGNEQLHLIPWDLDNAFENIINNTNAVTAIADEWGEISNDCQPFAAGWFGLQQRSAACDKLTAGWVTYEAEYQNLREQFFQGPCSAATVNQKIEEWTQQIHAATEDAHDAHSDALSPASWDQAVAKLKQQLDHARDQ